MSLGLASWLRLTRGWWGVYYRNGMVYGSWLIDIHLMTPVAELIYTRYLGLESGVLARTLRFRWTDYWLGQNFCENIKPSWENRA